MAKYNKKRTVIFSNVKENKMKAEEIATIKENQIDLDDEVIIGLNRLPKDKYPKTNKNSKISKQKKNDNQKKNKQKKNNSNNNLKKRRNKKIVIMIFMLLINIIVFSALIIGLVIFLKSSFFNISKISVKIDNNNILTESQIKDLSEINLGQNLFNIRKNQVIEKIKKEPYVEAVKIKKSLPNSVEILIKERSVEFQLLDADNQYIYIDNQGYILEKSDKIKEDIVITGYSTTDLTEGNRLNVEDLEKLSTVLQIIQEVENNGIREGVSKIDIGDSNDYKIYYDGLGKIVHLGDISSINDKMAYLKKILEVEHDYEGDIFLNVDLNSGEYPYFREKV